MAAKKIVLTGGPCAGKTTIAEVLSKAFESKVILVPEAATVLFRGGFPRWTETPCMKALQSAVYHVQKTLELSFEHHYPEKLLILDRGTIDGAAYWPEGTDKFFEAMNSPLQAELNTYARVIYLESAAKSQYDENKIRNPIRTESWEEAKRLDKDTRTLWMNHPHFEYIPNQRSFSDKIFSVLQIVEKELKG